MEINSRRVPPHKRIRTETSCDKCKTRKQKCDRQPGNAQCRYCEIHGITCTTTQPRKKRVHGSVEVVGSRIALLESLVKGLVPEADLSSDDQLQQLGKSLGIPVPVAETTYEDQENKANGDTDEEIIPLLPDQQGQAQYIGPASSFSFHLKLRTLIGNYSAFEFAMFGSNAADEATEVPSFAKNEDISGRTRSLISHGSSDFDSPSDAVRDLDSSIQESLIDAYFDNINCDFAVLHEASFRESYETWSTSTSTADPIWLCGLLCVLVLARRIVRFPIPEEAEKEWWRHIQRLLPTVIFSSNIKAIQALLLAALHLHNNTHRDACWNLTGTAVRIAFAIGLHRDDIKPVQTPLVRELRKQLWWTLYAFEQMQVSSYDRPTALGYNISSVGCPNERIVGFQGPHGFLQWSHRLLVLLGSACKALNPAGSGSTGVDDAFGKPLSPAAIVLRDLNKWKDALPFHLRPEVLDSLAPSSQRPLLLLHVQYHYTVVLISRSALLQRATALSKDPHLALPHALVTVSEMSVDSGRALAQHLKKLDSIGKFSMLVWWDTFYMVMASLILVLDITCRVKQHGPHSATESKSLLSAMAGITERQLQNPLVPGSMRKWGQILMDINATADELTSVRQPQIDKSTQLQTANQTGGVPAQTSGQEGILSAAETRDQISPIHDQGPQSYIPSGVSVLPRDHGPQSWGHFHILEDADSQAQGWHWDDIEAVLRDHSL